ncbi:mitochondria-eating isoform X1 [Pelobates cultripes]|uniref:Mitochondria-eating protein n=1 Tax=Pelobates cultripes TaxID=61616 RepID=A0AAD1WD38_PELCU|nr:mitochondria-eating isoform X1 [Pelobates cultripes]
MADTLRRLANSETCRLLQDKMEDWYKDYHINSCDNNLNVCCELLELHAKIQGQLFTILSVTAREGGQYAGVETLKSRFLPWLGSCFTTSSSSADSSFSLLQASILITIGPLYCYGGYHEKDLQRLETQLASTRSELSNVRQDLIEAQIELEDTKTKSASTLLATEEEILQLRSELRSTQDKLELRKLDSLDDYERQIRLLKDEISILSAEKSLLQGRISRSRSPSPLRHSSRSSSPFLRSESPARLTNSSRRARLISRFNDIFANDRLDAQNLLRRYIDELEMVQRIIFIATVESFHAAKMAFRQFKLRVRKTLSPSHLGPESLEDAVIDYIVRNLDCYDVQSSVNEVISAMNVNPKISFPPEVDFILISGFIREVCRLAFAMQTLEEPLDIGFAVDGELFGENKFKQGYLRTYDSDMRASTVYYHVWPALVQNNKVIVKGEAVTRRLNQSGLLLIQPGLSFRCPRPQASSGSLQHQLLSCPAVLNARVCAPPTSYLHTASGFCFLACVKSGNNLDSASPCSLRSWTIPRVTSELRRLWIPFPATARKPQPSANLQPRVSDNYTEIKISDTCTPQKQYAGWKQRRKNPLRPYRKRRIHLLRVRVERIRGTYSLGSHARGPTHDRQMNQPLYTVLHLSCMAYGPAQGLFISKSTLPAQVQNIPWRGIG